MSDFIPSGYVDHREAWRSAYLSLFKPLDSDDDVIAESIKVRENLIQNELRPKLISDAPPPINPIRSKNTSSTSSLIAKTKGVAFPDAILAESRQRELAALDVEVSRKVGKKWVEVYAFLWGNSYSLIADQRRILTRNVLLQSLFDGAISAYCSVNLTSTQIGYHEQFGMILPGPIEALKQAGLWASKDGATAIDAGELKWAYSKYDYETVRPILFKSAELSRAFPSREGSDGKTYRGTNLKEQYVSWYCEMYPNGHESSRLSNGGLRTQFIANSDRKQIGKATQAKAHRITRKRIGHPKIN